ncbi:MULTISPECIES: FAD-dependent thymidylate synthase [unclassified Burkholderia]|uniref:FAD-dependent thymidylate synthase n=1 Tax=unclassified Burkholderia TaxID=2613784 RepID=UPI000F561449|nr:MULTISPECIES: FAD-dependent thymidylate synthase [unclassified Burkholderia]RQR45562.1 FAD-dependent thymidylate synthase [Burkholderia sp. Bp9131]RQR77648.1 FAD-dependent thymidylate synthase [Burkholderia sp. Bp9015]
MNVQPRLYLIATSALSGGIEQFLDDQNLQWLRSGSPSAGEKVVEFSGRVCYMSFGPGRQRPQDSAAYIANLIRQGHESVLEHATFTILAASISRALSHQLVRHRAGFSYSQLSQQYHDETSASFVPPPGIDGDADALRLWNDSVSASKAAYSELLDALGSSPAGAQLDPKERNRFLRSVARSVLPAAIETHLVITANARSWRNLLEIRGSTSGDAEMLNFCTQAYEILSGHSPSLFADFERRPGPLCDQIVKKERPE